VNGNGCPRGVGGLECSGQGECTTSYHCHCGPGWRGYDCATKIDVSISKIDIDRPGKIKGVGPEQRDSTSNTTALVGGLVTFVIVVSIMFVVMAFRYLPARIPKDDRVTYPPIQTQPNANTECECAAEGPTPIAAT
jgi:hypothetical protein